MTSNNWIPPKECQRPTNILFLSAIEEEEESMTFQQMDADHYITPTDFQLLGLLVKKQKKNQMRSTNIVKTTIPETVAIMRLYGVTASGNSVLAHVHGYRPYFYVKAPPGFDMNDSSSMCENFRKSLDSAIEKKIGLKGGWNKKRKRHESEDEDEGGAKNQIEKKEIYVISIEPCNKQTIWNYQSEDRCDFLKISVSLPQHMSMARRILESGINFPRIGPCTFLTYESDVSFVMRYMVDSGIVGANWITLNDSFLIRPENKKTSSCQLEVDVLWDDVISHKPEAGTDWINISSGLRTLSFDIECCGRKGIFPVPEEDPVIQIANLVVDQLGNVVAKNIFTLNSCAPISGSEVFSFSQEQDLLKAWRDFFVSCDPDVVTGYNIVGFDIPYLIERAKSLSIENFPYLGRICKTKSIVKKTTFSSAQVGTRETYDITIEGRIIFDVIQAVRTNYKLHSYTLNSVAAHFLGEQKEDVHHSIIADLQNGDEHTRRRLAVYCLKDAYLPIRLMDKLMFLYNYVEMARVTGVPVGWLLVRGQMLKVMSQLLRKTKEKDLVIPSAQRCSSNFLGDDDKSFEGATVIDPIKGFYSEPVATLDFASLYPSIMMAHNLCYSTMISKRECERIGMIDGKDFTLTPCGDRFVKPSIKKGILPEILEELLQARKRAKADLKNAIDPMQKAVLDGRQLALKISANSVYGFTGAQVGKLPCLEISASVTSFGREMIELTKQKVEERYTVSNGYPHDAIVVYGDTDSVMIKFGVQIEDEKNDNAMVKRSMSMAIDAADYVNTFFLKPIKLEFEKVYYPYLLMNKKRYAALLWTNSEKFDKMDCKGIETVRRDNCGMVRSVIDKCLKIILMERDTEKAAEHVRSTVRNLLTNEIDLSDLIITKALHKTSETAKVPLAHVVLADKMRKRDPSTAPVLGDRVAYVMIQGTKKSKACENAEDPLYVLENNLPIDVQYYMEHHLENPIIRLFSPIMRNPESLLKGEHTRKICIKTPESTSSSAGGALMRFVKKIPPCLGCGIPSQSSSSICDHCKPREAEIYIKTLEDLSKKQEKFSGFWTQCQRCQGSLHQTVICSSRDCPIFYRRSKAHSDMIAAKNSLERMSF